MRRTLTTCEMDFIKDITGKVCFTAGVCFFLYLIATPPEVRFAGKAVKRIVKEGGSD